MLIFSKSDYAEREDSESSRLVRETPKKKPPRRDKRRNTIHPDRDSDPDLRDKDMSLNYKVVGSLLPSLSIGSNNCTGLIDRTGINEEYTMSRTNTANQILTNLDTLANTIEVKAASWGMPAKLAANIISELDKTADLAEVLSFGSSNLEARQAKAALTDPALARAVRSEVGDRLYGRVARVMQRDDDADYLDTFDSPSGIIEADADQDYLSSFDTDQTATMSDLSDQNGDFDGDEDEDEGLDDYDSEGDPDYSF